MYEAWSKAMKLVDVTRSNNNYTGTPAVYFSSTLYMYMYTYRYYM